MAEWMLQCCRLNNDNSLSHHQHVGRIVTTSRVIWHHRTTTGSISFVYIDAVVVRCQNSSMRWFQGKIVTIDDNHIEQNSIRSMINTIHTIEYMVKTNRTITVVLKVLTPKNYESLYCNSVCQMKTPIKTPIN